MIQMRVSETQEVQDPGVYYLPVVSQPERLRSCLI